WNYELLEREAAGVGRAGHRDDDAARVHAELSARHHGSGPDLLEGEHPEQLAESGQALVEHRLDRFVGRVARRDARAAGHEYGAHLVVRACLADYALDVLRLVADDRRSDDLMPGVHQELADELAARIRLGSLRIGHGQDPAA